MISTIATKNIHLETLQEAMVDGQTHAVDGLFYRAESGVFTIYNMAEESFELLA